MSLPSLARELPATVSEAAPATLSICCATYGRDISRLVNVLGLLRPIATEIVVALDERAEAGAGALGTVADRILLFPHAEPGDRTIAWLFRECRGEWIFNIDDDEVPSEALVAELPSLIRRTDITHCWIARRWLYPDVASYLDESPWNCEFQLRLFLADERFLRYSDVFHRPVSAIGPMRFVAAPLWHLDTAVTSRGQRQRKALAYERARRGMRLGPYSHNTGLYLPELRASVRLAPVPEADRTNIERVLAARVSDERRARMERAGRSAIDANWPGAPFAPPLYDATLRALATPPHLVAGVQQTIDVAVLNRGDHIWRCDDDCITVGTRWNSTVEGIRTKLPSDVRPGEQVVVPVHVLPGSEVGQHQLEIDLVHERVRWYGRPLRLALEVKPRRVVVVAGERAAAEHVLDALSLLPHIEPLVVTEPGDEATSFDLPCVDGVGGYLFGPDGCASWAALARSCVMLVRALARRDTVPFLAALKSSECLIVAGRNERAAAPPRRDALRRFVTIAIARAAGIPTYRLDESRLALPIDEILPPRLVASLGA